MHVKQSKFMRIILVLFVCFYATYSETNRIEYSISNFPDTLKRGSDSVVSVVIKNKSDTTVDLIKFPKSVEVNFTGKSKAIQIGYISSDDYQIIRLEPSKEYTQTLSISTFVYEDTVTCPHVDYSNCKNLTDSIKAGIVALCSKQKKPLHEGIYVVTVYINIIERGNKSRYFRLKRQLVVI